MINLVVLTADGSNFRITENKQNNKKNNSGTWSDFFQPLNPTHINNPPQTQKQFFYQNLNKMGNLYIYELEFFPINDVLWNSNAWNQSFQHNLPLSDKVVLASEESGHTLGGQGDAIIIIINDLCHENIYAKIDNIIDRYPKKPILFVIEILTYSHEYDKVIENLGKYKCEYRDHMEIIPKAPAQANLGRKTYDLLKILIDKTPVSDYRCIPIDVLVKQFSDNKLDKNILDHYTLLRIIYFSLTVHGYENTINPEGWFFKSLSKSDKLEWNNALIKSKIDGVYTLIKQYGLTKKFHHFYNNHPILWKI